MRVDRKGQSQADAGITAALKESAPSRAGSREAMGRIDLSLFGASLGPTARHDGELLVPPLAVGAAPGRRLRLQPRGADGLAAVDAEPERVVGEALAGGRDLGELGRIAVDQPALHLHAGLDEGLIDLVADVGLELRQTLVVDPVALFCDLRGRAASPWSRSIRTGQPCGTRFLGS